MNIDKDTEILKILLTELKTNFEKHPHTIAIMPRIEEEDVQAISNVLTQLNTNKYDINNYEERITSLKAELETYKKIAEKLAEKVEEIAYEMHLDEIYAELHNCNGMERNWTRGKEAEVKDVLNWARKEVEANETHS